MIRRVELVGLAVVIVLGEWPARGQQPAAQPPTFRSATNLVFVNVSVTQGRVPVVGLTEDDFELLDNGVRQSIDSLSVEAVPVDVSLVVDLSGSVLGNVSEFKSDVHAIATMLRPIDRVRVITFGSGVWEVVPMQAAAKDLSLDGIRPGGGSAVTDGLLYGLLWPEEPGRRHLVIVFTDGGDNGSFLEATALPEVAARVDAVLHAVLVDVSGIWTATMQASRDALVEATRRTGGTTHRLRRAKDDFKQIFDDFRASYILRFSPTSVRRDGWHDLTVRVTRPGAATYTVAARKGYFGG